MGNIARAAAVALPLAIAMTLGAGAARADQSCFFTKTEVLGQLVPTAAETAWLSGDSAAKASAAIAGDFAKAAAPIVDVVGLVNSSGSVFALGFDKNGCALVGGNLTLEAFNAALATVGHDPLPLPPKKPMTA